MVYSYLICMNIPKAMIRKLYEGGFFKGKLKEAFMRKSPISVSLCTMPIGDALDLLNTMDMANRSKLLEFLGRFTEEQIATNGWASYRYAVDVLKGRFPLGERAIKEDLGAMSPSSWGYYVKQFKVPLDPLDGWKPWMDHLDK
jgi:hypothetical protein